MVIKLGVWISNLRSRRDRLTADQLASLAALGVDWAGAVPAVPAAAAKAVPVRPAAGTRPVPSKRLPQREHHDECDTALYDGGACTCDLIEQLGPPSERNDTTWTTSDRSPAQPGPGPAQARGPVLPVQ